MFIESAEGGAGALRRLVDDPSALAQAVRTALRIMHFNPGTGADESADEPAKGRERCVRACYDCLLAYGNQGVHEMIDRHLVRDLFLRLATATVEHPDADNAQPPPQAGNPQAAEFVAWLRSPGLRLPDQVDQEAHSARPDLIYRLPYGNVAVFIADTQGAGRDEQAQDDLRDLGWSVVILGPGTDWEAAAARYPSVFGTQEGTR